MIVTPTITRMRRRQSEPMKAVAVMTAPTMPVSGSRLRSATVPTAHHSPDRLPHHCRRALIEIQIGAHEGGCRHDGTNNAGEGIEIAVGDGSDRPPLAGSASPPLQESTDRDSAPARHDEREQCAPHSEPSFRYAKPDEGSQPGDNRLARVPRDDEGRKHCPLVAAQKGRNSRPPGRGGCG